MTDTICHPSLRAELQILPAEHDSQGFPTWTIYDPPRNKYFRIGWLEFEILSRWQLRDFSKIIVDVNQQTTLSIDTEDTQSLLHFLITNDLVEIDSPLQLQQLIKRNQLSKKLKWKQLLRSYVFFKIKLCRPDPFLSKSIHYIKFMFNPRTLIIFMLLALMSLYLIMQQWHEFSSSIYYFFNSKGLLFFVLALILTKVIHELGHGYIAKYYGCHVTSMGVAFIVFWPILYTDTSDAWRLANKKSRLMINAGGIIAELMLAVIASLIWSFTSPGIIQSICFFIASSAWLMTLLVNLNPLMRFDGYFLLADLIGIHNLQQQSFSVARWHLRKTLFGIMETPPQYFTKRKQRGLIIYAYCTWVYRLCLFFSIALLIYHFFFKALGLLLMVVQIYLLILQPIIHEAKACWQRRDLMSIRLSNFVSLFFLVGVLVFLFFPWQQDVSLPAFIRYQAYQKIYSKLPGKIIAVNNNKNPDVKAGSTLIAFSSAQLNYEIQQQEYDIKITKIKIFSDQENSSRLGFRQTDEQELQQHLKKLEALKEKQKQLTIYAPFSGKIIDEAENLAVNQYLPADSYLFEIIKNNQQIIEAYVPEEDYQAIKKDHQALFYADNFALTPIKATIVKVDKSRSKNITTPYLTSLAGGELLVSEENHALILNDSYYRVILKPQENLKQLPLQLRGTIHLEGNSTTIFNQIFIKLSAVFIRESGF